MNSICLVGSLGHPKFVQSNSGTLIVGKKSVGNRREVGFHPSSRKVGFLSVTSPAGGIRHRQVTANPVSWELRRCGWLAQVWSDADGERSRLTIERRASKCRTTPSGTNKAGINRNGNVPNRRLGTSEWIRCKGPGAVSTARVTTLASERRPSTFQASASLKPSLPLAESQAINTADAPT